MEGIYLAFYVGFIAGVAWPAFQQPVRAAMFGPGFWRAKVADGWVPAPAQDFYLELARYKQEKGADGQLPGDFAWAFAYCGVYWGTMVLAIALAWFDVASSSISLLAAFSLLEFPAAFACYTMSRRRSRRQFDAAVLAGYPFPRYRLGRLHRLQP